MNAYDIIRKPVNTEKGLAGADSATKKYVFVVDKRANKTQIKAAIEEMFKVKVEKVNTANMRGKLKRQGKNEGYTPAFKKAYVKLTEGSPVIKLFESLK